MKHLLGNSYSRRDVLRFGAYGAATSAMWLTLGGSSAPNIDSSGYKALVCVYLAGGNNGFNMIVPTSRKLYDVYARSRTNLALPMEQLLPLNGEASDGFSYGMHPAMSEARDLFNAGHIAVMGNVGTLKQPTKLSDARAGAAPLQLFSHLDQQTEWMTSLPNETSRVGWAGRIADLYVQQGLNAKLAVNIAVGGSNYWQEGASTQPYTLSPGEIAMLKVTNNENYRGGARRRVALDLLQQGSADSNLMVAQFANIELLAASKAGIARSALNNAGDFTTPFPFDRVNSGLNEQLHQVARTIKAHAALDTRQIFFVQLNGFDTHNGELSTQQDLLGILSANMKSFWMAMNEIGIQNDVTLFTMSEFGRTLSSNGDGSDHAWGNHHLVMGGAVQGGFFGTMPDLALDGADDVGAGRILPSTSTSQYGATLTRWFGVPDAQLNTVFPDLANFPTRTLPFLG